MFLFKFRTSRELLSSCPHVIKDDPLPIKMDSEQNVEYNKMCKYDEDIWHWPLHIVQAGPGAGAEAQLLLPQPLPTSVQNS